MPAKNCNSRKWSTEENAKLTKLWNEKKPPREIADQMDRTVGAIHSRRSHLELKPRNRYEHGRPTYKVKGPACKVCMATLVAVAQSYLEGNNCFRAECPYLAVFYR